MPKEYAFPFTDQIHDEHGVPMWNERGEPILIQSPGMSRTDFVAALIAAAISPDCMNYKNNVDAIDETETRAQFIARSSYDIALALEAEGKRREAEAKNA